MITGHTLEQLDRLECCRVLVGSCLVQMEPKATMAIMKLSVYCSDLCCPGSYLEAPDAHATVTRHVERSILSDSLVIFFFFFLGGGGGGGYRNRLPLLC